MRLKYLQRGIECGVPVLWQGVVDSGVHLRVLDEIGIGKRAQMPRSRRKGKSNVLSDISYGGRALCPEKLQDRKPTTISQCL